MLGEQVPKTDGWPGQLIRKPKKSSVTYPTRSHLARWLEAEARRAADDYGRYRVLDVGCGKKPYLPVLRSRTPSVRRRRHRHREPSRRPGRARRGRCRSRTSRSRSCSARRCSSTPATPTRPSRELLPRDGARRARARLDARRPGLPPGARRPLALDAQRASSCSSPGTPAGARSRSIPRAATATCLGGDDAVSTSTCSSGAVHLTPVAKGLVWLLNSSGATLDRRIPSLRETKPGSIFLNYHVVAEKPTRDPGSRHGRRRVHRLEPRAGAARARRRRARARQLLDRQPGEPRRARRRDRRGRAAELRARAQRRARRRGRATTSARSARCPAPSRTR